MENKRKILYRAFSIGVLAILLALGGWFISSRLDPHYNAWSGFSSQDKSSDTVTVRLKLLHGPQFAGMYVAQEKGWYKDVGLKVDLLERDFRSPSTGDEVRDGQVDFGILNPLEILARHASQEPIKAVAAIFQHSPSTLVSLAKNPVTKPEQIRNKTIGVTTQQPESLTLANTLLRKYKVPMNTVVFTTTGPEQIPTLLSGGADAVFMYSTSLPKLDTKNVQYKTLSPSQYGIDTYDDVIVTSHNLVDTNPTLVQNFITATLKGWEYASQNPQDQKRHNR
jgi:ABC-type nitrate/sulfonate/bicarbonate transport system substrate-binding protein